MIYLLLPLLASIAIAQEPPLESKPRAHSDLVPAEQNLWDRIDVQKLDQQLAEWYGKAGTSDAINPSFDVSTKQLYPEVPQPISPIRPPPPPTEIPLPQGCLASRGQFPSPRSCAHYINCWDDVAVEQQCPGGLLFNDILGVCDFEYNVYCSGRPGLPPKPELPPGSTVCPDPNGRYRSSTNCSVFYLCVYGKPVKYSCPRGLVYNEDLGVCDYIYNVDCRSAAVPPPPPPTPQPQPHPPGQPQPHPPGQPQPHPPGQPQPHPPGQPQPHPPGQPQPHPPGQPQPHPPGQPQPHPPGQPQPHPPGQPQPQPPVTPRPQPPVTPRPQPPITIGPQPPVTIRPQPPITARPPTYPPRPHPPPVQPQPPIHPGPRPPVYPPHPQPPVQPGYPSQPQPGYPSQPQPGYPSQPQPGYPSQPQPGYPSQPQPGYPSQPQPGYPSQPQPGYPSQPQPGYPSQPQPGYPGNPWLGQRRESNPWSQRPSPAQIAMQEAEKLIQQQSLEQNEQQQDEPVTLVNPWGQVHAIPAQLTKVPCNDGDIYRLTESCSSVVVCRTGRPQLLQCPLEQIYDRPSDSCKPFSIAKC